MPIGFNGGMKTLSALLLVSLSLSAAADNPYAVEAAIYKVEVPNGEVTYNGTGVLVASDKILTNCHIVNHGGWPHVIHRKTGDQFKVAKYYQLGKYDACVLVGGFVGTPVRFSADVVPGENIWLFGFPKGLPVVGQGSVLGYVETQQGQVLKLGAFCAAGSSGGPVVNVKGELIGLNYATFKYQDQCLSIPASVLRNYLM